MPEKELVDAIYTVWATIRLEVLEHLALLLPRRIGALLQARGKQKKYLNDQ